MIGSRRRVQPEPWSTAYYHERDSLVSDAFADADLLRRFAAAGPLPRGYGAGFDERVVEYPWLAAQRPRGRVLDAGSTLNHAHVLDELLGSFNGLCIVTLASEGYGYLERGVSYVYSDLRELPFRGCLFETVVSLSTLEHVGCDNSRFGDERPAAADPRPELERAVRELRRVTRPGGRVLLTIPFGRYEHHGWFRQLDANALDELVGWLEPRASTETIYRYRGGWQLDSRRGSRSARYGSRTIAASAVACITAEL